MSSHFWRAVQHDPETVAKWADWPVNEVDLIARQNWLVANRAAWTEWLRTDPDFYDVKAAGWWVWGQCQWIGSDFCHRRGNHKLPEVSSNRGIFSERCRDDLLAVMRKLCDRLRRVHICCGDWSRVLTPACTSGIGVTAVFLDPPYSLAERESALYAVDGDIAHDIARWAIEHGDDPLFRIALCGYDGEHSMPDTWTTLRWKAQGGYSRAGNSRGRDNAHRETVCFSPHCLPVLRQQPTLFEGLPDV